MPTVTITAPSRLHFGMFCFGNPHVRQYGGVGVMLKRPRLKLILQNADHSNIQFNSNIKLSEKVQAEYATRIEKVVRNVSTHLDLSMLPSTSIRIEEVLPQHAGLGSGTQLALAVAKAMLLFCGAEVNSIEQLVSLANRGKRSAVGSYGFEQGGFIIDAGKLSTESLAPLQVRTAFPDSWHWVLLHLKHGKVSSDFGLSGTPEKLAFDQLPPVPQDTTAALEKEALEVMLPAVQQADFKKFSESLYRFGCLAGSCFATIQGGNFASVEIANAVERLRNWGIAGVGQSSWGPTIFAITENKQAAEELVRKINNDQELKSSQTQITTAANNPAQVTVSDD